MTSSVCLPTGLWVDGVHHRTATVRAVTGDDEAALFGLSGLPPARRVTELLARCVVLDGVPGEPRAQMRSLTVGDREALLLHLRRTILGDDLSCTMRCPLCDERMDLPLRVRDLLVPPYDNPQPIHELSVDDQGTSFEVRFRLPSGEAQELAADKALSNAGESTRYLLLRCLETVVVDGAPAACSQISAAAGCEVAKAMSELDAQAEIALELVCPSCERSCVAIFDTASVFLRELDERAQCILREVHCLALHYHWSEGDILAMPRPRRRQYLALLSENTPRPT